MATNPPRKQPSKAATQAVTATPPAAVPPVVDTAPAVVADELPVAAAVAAETVAGTLSDIRAAVTPAALQQKGKTMIDTVKDMGRNAAEQGQQFAAEMKDRAETAAAKGKALLGDAGEFNKGNLEALVESGKIAAKGIEKMGQDAADYARRSFEHTTAAFKGMAQVKSPTELMKLHNDYVRSSFDMFVAEASRSTEASLKLAGEIAQPISNRLAVAAEKVKLAA